MKESQTNPPRLLMALLLAVLVVVSSAYAQNGATAKVDQETPAATKAPTALKVMSELKGVKVGMKADEVVKMLGKPESRDDGGMYFDLSKGQAMQLAFDDSKNIVTLSMFFTGKDADAPEFGEVFGTTDKPEKQENGSVFKRIRYPELGIWIAYSQIGEGDGAMTTVTIQKIRE